MKFSIQKESLLKALTIASKAIPQKASTPILETFRIAAFGNVLEVMATDGDMIITSIATCETYDEDVICINAKTILEIVRLCPDGELTIESEGVTAKVSWSGGHSSIPTSDAMDFPDISSEIDGEVTEINAATFKTALSHVIPHVATDILRPQLTGVHFNPTESGIDVVASDSHTICVYPIEGHLDAPVTIPAKCASVARDAADGLEYVRVYKSKNGVSFECGQDTITAREIIGKFPAYNKIIPTANENVLTSDKRELLSTLRLVSVCSNKASNHIRLDLSSLVSKVSAQDIGFGTSATDDLTAEYAGDEMAIGFRHDLLTKSISCLDGDKVSIQLDKPNKAVLISADGDPSKVVVMPVAIK